MKTIIKKSKGIYVFCILLCMALGIYSYALYAQYNSSNSGNQTYSTAPTGQTGSTQGQSPPSTSQGNVYGQGPVTSGSGSTYEEPKPALNSKYVKTYVMPKPKRKVVEKTMAEENPAGEVDNTRVETDTPLVTTTTSTTESASHSDVAAINTMGDNTCSCTSQRLAYGLLAAAVAAFTILLFMFMSERKHHHHHDNTGWRMP